MFTSNIVFLPTCTQKLFKLRENALLSKWLIHPTVEELKRAEKYDISAMELDALTQVKQTVSSHEDNQVKCFSNV